MKTPTPVICRSSATAAMAMLVGLMSTGGCGRPSVPAHSTVRDSAGVRIVQNVGTAAATSGWELSRRPRFRSGWEDDEPTFELLWYGAVRDDGSVVVADANGNSIYEFDPDGRLRYKLGGPGQGPGEFEHLEAVVLGGQDTIFGQDGFIGGLSTFASGELVSDQRVGWGWIVGLSLLNTVARTEDGAFVLTPGAFSPAPGDWEWSSAPILRVSPDLEIVDTLLVVDHFLRRPRGDRNPIRHLGTGGVSRSQIVYARTDQAEVRWYDLSGELIQVARWDHSFREPTADDWAAYERATRSRGSPELNEERLNRMLADRRDDFKGVLPAFGRFLVDPAGNAWLADYTYAGESARTYSILRSDGHWLGTIEIPSGTRVLAVGDEYLLGVQRDDWDIQAVVVYEIIKT